MQHRPGLVAGSGQLVAGRYRLAEQIGRGAMGIVWRGRDELLDREIAVKQVRQHPLGAPGKSLVSQQRTLREARSAARLSHPNVITIYDVVEDGGSPWIIMELIHARPLDQVIAEDGPLPPAAAARLGEMLLGALVTAHGAGVLHRDVKPGNVLITADGQAVLTDFGIATVEGEPGLTQAGMVAGTPGFAAPERVRGFPATPASDFWSLGATLYAAVEGRGPYDRPGGTSVIIAAIATDPPPRAPSAGPLAPAIEALLQPDPARRPDRFAAARLLAPAADPAVTSGQGGAAISLPGPAPRWPGETAAPAAADPAAGTGLAAEASAHDAPTAPAPRAGAGPGSGRPGLPGHLAPPPFGELSMPVTANRGQGGPGVSSLRPAAGHQDAASGPLAVGAIASATGGVPPAGAAGSTAAGAGRRTGSRAHGRWRIGVAAGMAAAVVAGGLGWLSFAALPGLIGGQGADRLPGAAASAGARGHQAGHRPHGRSGLPGRAGAPDPGSGLGAPPSPGATASGRLPGTPGTGHPVAGGGGPGSPRSPGPGKTPSPSGSPSPHPAPPPPGFYWQTVTGASIGTTAGYRVAVPDGWRLDTLGIATRFSPPAGSISMTVNLTPFAFASPVREARYLQQLLRADLAGSYRQVSLRASTYRGQPAAMWRYLDQPSLLRRPRFAAVALVTLPTAAGPQPYALSVSAPAAQRGGVSALFAAELAAFSPVG